MVTFLSLEATEKENFPYRAEQSQRKQHIKREQKQEQSEQQSTGRDSMTRVHAGAEKKKKRGGLLSFSPPPPLPLF